MLFLEYVLQEIDYLTRHQTPVSLLNSCMNEITEIHELLLQPEKVKSQTAAKIIIYLGKIDCNLCALRLNFVFFSFLLGHNSPPVLISSMSYLFQNASSFEHLALLVRILTNELVDKTAPPYNDKGGHFTMVLEQILSKHLECANDDGDLSRIWQNLLTLLR